MKPTRLLTGSAIFLAAFLLFLVEPMAARELAPIFGGSAAVWITCLVFFQTALVAAYLYAHWQAQGLRRTLHWLLLLPALACAVRFACWRMEWGGAFHHPALAIFVLLAASIGLPFLLLGATSPLLQAWRVRMEPGEAPYRLFALSNLASLAALALYPAAIEPYFTLASQRAAWAIGFAAFAILLGALTWLQPGIPKAGPGPGGGPLPRFGEPEDSLPPAPKAPLVHKLLWLLLPMGAAVQLAAVTRHITENVAAIPLLWILPLAVYLVTLIVAFDLKRPAPRWLVTRLLVVLLAGLGYMLAQPEGSLPLRAALFFFLAELFLACLLLHTEACQLRPRRASEATLFYLLFSAGGALGAFLVGIASPLLFSFNYDLALSFFLTAALALAVVWTAGWGQRLLWITASLLLLALVFCLRVAYHRDTPVAVRNFYGSLRVKQTLGYPGAVVRTLSNGTIQHGTQIFTPELAQTATTYYAADSGIGLSLRWCCGARGRNIGVIGLGAGTLAAYGRSGDRLTFYEIDPAVLPIAQNLFTYLRDATQRGARIDIVEGDARTSLATGAQRHFDVLAIDAFSGDAIPLHLLTAQAVELYKRNLAPGGILAFHISNQHVDLEPEVARLAAAGGLKAMRVTSAANAERGEFSATWMLATANPSFFSTPEVFNQASEPVLNPKVRLWTDDYSSLLPVLRW